jgi:hypothetical protein
MRKPTPCRWNDRLQTRAARELVAKKTYEEKQAPRTVAQEQWTAWVRPYLAQRYDDREKTRERFLSAWRTIESFLIGHHIETPAQLNHQGVAQYIAWRKQSRRTKPIAAGTILIDTKILRTVMDEAIRRGWATVNPCVRLGISRKPVQETCEIKDAEASILLLRKLTHSSSASTKIPCSRNGEEPKSFKGISGTLFLEIVVSAS